MFVLRPPMCMYICMFESLIVSVSTQTNGKSESAEENADKKQEDEPLDLDKLGSYTLAELKAYCSTERLQVTGTKKADYIKAIEVYNAE